jgi:ComF family protein
MKVFDELLDLLLPTRCALCDILGSALCSNCIGEFQLARTMVVREGLVGAVAAQYGAKEQKVLHAFKEKGQTSLGSFLAEPLAEILSQLAVSVDRPILVPVPSSRENYKKRGFTPTKLLGKSVCKESSQVCVLVDSLRFQRKVVDQSHLDSEARRGNLAGSMVSDARVSGRQVIIFDDVVTTGSTILEATRAVTAAGGNVVSFLAFAETILKTHSKT